jgi:cytochrome c peroxidase
MNNVQPNRRASALKSLFVLALLPVAAALSTGAPARRGAADDALAAWRAAFARPAAIPAPPGNPVTPQRVDLGRALFTDTRLSGDGTMACVTCHDPACPSPTASRAGAATTASPCRGARRRGGTSPGA